MLLWRLCMLCGVAVLQSPQTRATANNVPRLPRLVQTTVPRQKLVARGKVPSPVQDLHYIEPVQDLYLRRGTGTNLLAREGGQGKASHRYMNSCIATELALQHVPLLQQTPFCKMIQTSETHTAQLLQYCYRACLYHKNTVSTACYRAPCAHPS